MHKTGHEHAEHVEPRQRMRAQDRRQQILDTAEALFRERGFEQVTMGDIATELGISRPAVYTYFPSTTAILDALFDTALDRLWGRIEPLIQAKQCDPHLPVIPAVLSMLVEDRALLTVLHSGGSSAFHRRCRDLLSERLAPLLEPYLPPGHGPYDVVILITLLEGMAFWAVTQDIDDIGPLAESVDAFIRHGFGPAWSASSLPDS